MIQISWTEHGRKVHILPLALKSLKPNIHILKDRRTETIFTEKIIKENSDRHTGNALLTLPFGPSHTRLQLPPNDCANGSLMKERSAESSVGAEGSVSTAESNTPCCISQSPSYVYGQLAFSLR